MKPGMCVDVMLRQMEHVVVMEKLLGSGSRPQEGGRRAD